MQLTIETQVVEIGGASMELAQSVKRGDELLVEVGRRVASCLRPADFVARYQTGETAGGLEKALLVVAADYQVRANQRLAAASVLYPGLLFSAVVVMVAYVVIGFFMNYVATLNKLMDAN
jgi:type II secretory pathway component PulF